MKVSIIMTTYNRKVQLGRGLRTILNQENLPEDLEIIVVDDGSTDETWGYLAENFMNSFPVLTYIYLNHPEPRISCIPRNVGIKNATGDIILFTEPEALHVGNTISDMLKAMEENPNNTILASQVWTIGPRIYQKLSEEEFSHPARILNHPYAMIAIDSNAGNSKAPDSDFAITGEMNCNAGVFFGTRKQWLLDIGGFDEEFFGHGGDDFNLYDRLALYGKGIKKVNHIPVIHQWHEKNYPYNIYEAAEKNLSSWKKRLEQGEYRANIGKEWGKG